jgi:hypothetical protein
MGSMVDRYIACVIDRSIAVTITLVVAASVGTSTGAVDVVATGAASDTAVTTAPILNNNQSPLNSGSPVTLSWTMPAVGTPVSYVIEASSVPGGPPNLANFNTGNPATSLVVPNVPVGTYYVRVRALDETGLSAPSNEVQLVVGAIGGACPSAPRALSIVSQSGGTVALGWQAPLTGVPASYVIQAGSFANGSNLANFDTNSTALSLAVSNVPAGSYFIRVYGRSDGCGLGPPSNEVLLSVGSVGAAASWTGPIVCRTAITGAGGYRHDETQTWIISGPGQTVGPRTFYPIQWTAQGSGGATGKSWTINSTATADLTVTTVASTGIPFFDRTTAPIIIRGGIVGTPTSFDLYEMEFPAIVAGFSTATSVSGTWSRPIVGGDSPQQPGGSVGTLSCTWSLTYR